MLPKMFDMFRTGDQIGVRDHRGQLDTSKLTRTLENVILYTYNQNVNALNGLSAGISNALRNVSTFSNKFLDDWFKLISKVWKQSAVFGKIFIILLLMLMSAALLSVLLLTCLVGVITIDKLFMVNYRPGPPVSIIPFDDGLYRDVSRFVSSKDDSMMILSFPIGAHVVPRWEVSNIWHLSISRTIADVYYKKNTVFTSTPTSISEFSIYNTTQHSATVAARVAVIIDGEEASHCFSSTSERLVDVRIELMMNYFAPVSYFGRFRREGNFEKIYRVCCSEQKYCSG